MLENIPTQPKNTNKKPISSQKICPACPRTSRRLLAVAIVVPGGQVLDLCRGCARTVRYGSPAEREAIALSIAAYLDRKSLGERRAAA